MFKPLMVSLAAVVVISCPVAAQQVSGTFGTSGEVAPGEPPRISIQYGRANNVTLRMSEPERASIPAQGPVAMTLRRDAGTLELEGSSRAGIAAGHFVFTPSKGFVEALRSRGVRVENEIDEMDLLLMAALGVDLAFVDSLATVGFTGLSSDRLTEMAIHGVSAGWVRSMRDAGYALDEKAAVAFRIHRVTPELVRTYAANGYDDLSRETLMSMAIHRVTPEFITGMREAGYTQLPASKLVEMRIHRVTPEYVRELTALGYGGLSAARLVEMRIHRVDPDFIRKANKAMGGKVDVDKLIRMRIHRIDPAELRGSGN